MKGPIPKLPALPEITSFKIRLPDHHVRVVPRRDLEGCAFAGPGVDFRGEDARIIIEAAAPLFVGLSALEPNAVWRAISVDVDLPRVIATREATPHPQVVRIEGPACMVWLNQATTLLPTLEAAVRVALFRRKDR